MLFRTDFWMLCAYVRNYGNWDSSAQPNYEEGYWSLWKHTKHQKVYDVLLSVAYNSISSGSLFGLPPSSRRTTVDFTMMNQSLAMELSVNRGDFIDRTVKTSIRRKLRDSVTKSRVIPSRCLTSTTIWRRCLRKRVEGSLQVIRVSRWPDITGVVLLDLLTLDCQIFLKKYSPLSLQRLWRERRKFAL